MKTANTITLACLVLTSSPCNSADLLTTKGTRYSAAVIIDQDLTHIKVRHQNGFARVPKTDISPDSAKEFNLKLPNKAATASSPEISQVDTIRRKFIFIETKDGRKFYTKDLSQIDPNGLRFLTSSGISKVKFTELQPMYLEAVGFDADKADLYEKRAAQADAAAKRKQAVLLQAATIIESSKFEAKIIPVQKVNAGWLCKISERKTVTVEVETDRSFNKLSGTWNIYKSTQERDVSGESESALLWGMSDTFAAKNLNISFSSEVYLVGKYIYNTLGNGESEVFVYMTDKSEAIRYLAKNGLTTIRNEDVSPDDIKRTDGPAVATGTGFFISADGYVVTNNHVIDGATKIELLIDGKSQQAELIAVDVANDLALLKAELTERPYIALSNSDTVSLGDTVYTLGFPRPSDQGRNPKFTEGSISALTGLDDEDSQFQMSVPIQPGNSGGPLVNSEGNVVGVVASTLNALRQLANGGGLPQNVNYAIKSVCLMDLLRDNSIELIPQNKESVPELVSGDTDDTSRRKASIDKTRSSVVMIRAELSN